MPALQQRRAVIAAGVASVGLSAAIGFGIADDWKSTTTTNTASSLRTQKATAGPVTITVKPQRLDLSGAAFALTVDNHQIDLDMNLAAAAKLSVGAVSWGPAKWRGDAPGGHHREGTLTFSPGGTTGGQVVLQLAGFRAPVRFEWALPAGGGSS